MKGTISFAVCLALIVATAGCGSKRSGSAPSETPPGGAAAAPAAPAGTTPAGTPSGAPGGASSAPATKAGEGKPEAKPAAKKDDDSDNPFGATSPARPAPGGQKSLARALGIAFLRAGQSALMTKDEKSKDEGMTKSQ